MALKEPLMVRYLEVTDATSVELLTPGAGEGYKVKSIQLTGDVSDSATSQAFCTFKVDRTTIGFWRVGSTAGNHLRWETETSAVGSLFSYLVRQNIMPPIPLQQGESLILEFSQAYTGGILVEYEVYDTGDINNTAPLGSKATEMYYVLYGTNVSDIASDGYHELTAVWNPPEFIKAPFGERVPAGFVVEVLACLAQDVGRYVDASNYCITTYLRFLRGNVELFDREMKGFVMKGSYSTTAGYYYGSGYSYFNPHKYNTLQPIKFFPTPLVLTPGEELKIFVGVDVTGSNGVFQAGTIDVPLLIHLRRAG